jgi:hypothetical protein
LRQRSWVEVAAQRHIEYNGSVFDIGVRKNFAAVFGNKWQFWFLPTHIEADGHNFELNPRMLAMDV